MQPPDFLHPRDAPDLEVERKQSERNLPYVTALRRPRRSFLGQGRRL
jgi:hypothetical protein